MMARLAATWLRRRDRSIGLLPPRREALRADGILCIAGRIAARPELLSPKPYLDRKNPATTQRRLGEKRR